MEKIEFDEDELEMIKELLFNHKNKIGYSIFYGGEILNQEYKEIAESAYNKVERAINKISLKSVNSFFK